MKTPIAVIQIDIPSAFVLIDQKQYLITSGPVTYIMEQTRKGWKDCEAIPDEHMKQLRMLALTLWNVKI
jgi:hypothetical protein